MEIVISGQYANLSRGRICAKHVKSGEWAEKSGSTVTLNQPGKWMISQTDGFSRKETVYVEVEITGEVSGLSKRMHISSHSA